MAGMEGNSDGGRLGLGELVHGWIGGLARLKGGWRGGGDLDAIGGGAGMVAWMVVMMMMMMMGTFYKHRLQPVGLQCPAGVRRRASGVVSSAYSVVHVAPFPVRSVRRPMGSTPPSWPNGTIVPPA